MEIDRIMIFGFTDCTPGCLAVIHVERIVFCQVVPLFLENVGKRFGLHESNVLSAVFLLTIIFGVVVCRAFGALDLLILEV